MLFKSCVAAGLSVGAIASISQAAIPQLATYTFATDASASNVAVGITASAFGTGGQGLRSGSGPSYVETYANITSTDDATSLASDDYFTFTLTPAAGNKINASELDFNTQVHFTTAAGNTLGGSYDVRSSLDNYAATLGTFTTAPTSTSDPAVTRTINLAALTAFQNVTTPITFRIYLFDNGSTFSGDGMRVENVVVQGTVATPEPASLAMLGLGGLAMLRRRRRA